MCHYAYFTWTKCQVNTNYYLTAYSGNHLMEANINFYEWYNSEAYIGQNKGGNVIQNNTYIEYRLKCVSLHRWIWVHPVYIILHDIT